MAKYNLKPLILATLNERGLGKFQSLAADIEAVIEPAVEKNVRDIIGRVLKRVMREALNPAKKQEEEITLELI